MEGNNLSNLCYIKNTVSTETTPNHSFSMELTTVEPLDMGVTGDLHLKHVTDAGHRRIHVAAAGPRADEIVMLCIVNH